MAAKKGSAKKSGSKTSVKSNKQGRQQAISVVLFGISLLMLANVLIPSENAWKAIHDFLFGLFGWLTYIVPIFLIVVSVIYAMGKLREQTLLRVIGSAVIFLLIGGAIDIFLPHPVPAEGFNAHLNTAYLNGVAFKNAGFFGGLVGHPLFMAFGQAGAGVTICVLIFVVVLLTTGIGIIPFFKALGKPIAGIEKGVSNSFQKRIDNKTEVSVNDIDIPIGNGKKKKEVDESVDQMGQRVISTYHGEDVVPTDDTEPDEASPTVGEALAAAKREAKRNKKIADEARSEIEEAAAEDIEMVREGYKYPPIDLLKKDEIGNAGSIEAEMEQTADRLVETLRSFGVETRIVDISRGPTVTRYELQPSAGVKISKITNLADDIALNLAAAGVRIEAPIPGKAAVGIEIPNRAGRVVRVRDLLESPVFTNSKSKLTIALGKDIAGNAIVTDIQKMPHGLIAGSTGSGKSVCINSIIMSILYKASPDEVKLIMIDPKVVELAVYNGIPHLYVPVVTDPRKAAGTLGWAVSEMEHRYHMFAANNVRDIDGYNKLAESDSEMKKLPRIVIIIDELADLMMTAPKEVEESINRIAAKARAAGMHLIIATQRPSVDVVTGVIKANIPTRIAFLVSSQVDSRTILDHAGAEKLLGKGDMLFNPAGAIKPSRIQGCFVTDDEVERVVDYVKADHTADYDKEIMAEIERQSQLGKKDHGSSNNDDGGEEVDSMLNAAIDVVIETGQASTSMLQRRLKLGYARAARLMDEMEARGIIGGYEGAKPRAVLITREEWMEQQAGEE